MSVQLEPAALVEQLRADAGQILFEMHPEAREHAVRDRLWAAADMIEAAEAARADMNEATQAIIECARSWQARAEAAEAVCAEKDRTIGLLEMSATALGGQWKQAHARAEALQHTQEAERLTHDDLARLSRGFNASSDLRTEQDVRVNEWLKRRLAEAQ